MRSTDFVDSYFQAWNHRDPVGVANHLANNGLYVDVPEHTSRTRNELVASLYGFFAEFRHRYELVGDVIAARNAIAFQYRMMPLDGDEVEAGVEYRGAEFITLNDDLAVTIMDYYDVPGSTRPAILPQSRRSIERWRKYAKSGLDDKQLLAYKRRLEEIMRAEKVYLQSDLTLPKLARIVDCSINHLSQVINAGFGVSFFDFLNQYRIEYARKLLGELDGRDKAILNIAYAVGFNSNSAFYAAFKKYVGRTPAQYRRSHVNRDD
jgi:AraC-like DNA-binding protein